MEGDGSSRHTTSKRRSYGCRKRREYTVQLRAGHVGQAVQLPLVIQLVHVRVSRLKKVVPSLKLKLVT